MSHTLSSLQWTNLEEQVEATASHDHWHEKEEATHYTNSLKQRRQAKVGPEVELVKGRVLDKLSRSFKTHWFYSSIVLAVPHATIHLKKQGGEGRGIDR